MTAEQKQTTIAGYRVHDKDSGSPEVQVALLTERIEGLTQHLKGARKDHSSRRGLLQMVSTRKRLLSYLAKKDKTRYAGLVERLKLRK